MTYHHEQAQDIDHFIRSSDLVLQSGTDIEDCEDFMEYGNLLFLSSLNPFAQDLDSITTTRMNDYFLAIGSDIEKRNIEGHTPLLAAAAKYCRLNSFYLQYLLNKALI
jgi:hypothetical protein